MNLNKENQCYRSLIKDQELKTKKGYWYTFKTAQGYPAYTKHKLVYDENEEIRKWKVGLSLTSGCPIKCSFCYTQGMSHFYKLSSQEIVDQALYCRAHPLGEYDVFKIDLKTMGDPLMNPLNTLEAIKKLHEIYPDSPFTVSTAVPCSRVCPRPFEFFSNLRKIRDGENIMDIQTKIRLQFSCHSTSDKDRKILHPVMPVMKLEEISKIVDFWYDGNENNRVTLNFVPFQGCRLNAHDLSSLFDPRKVFIKISYMDKNKFTEMNKLYEKDPKDYLDLLIQDLEHYKFKYAFRGN